MEKCSKIFAKQIAEMLGDAFHLNYLPFDLLFGASQFFAFVMVILAGYYHQIADDGMKGKYGKLHYHGLLMSYGLIFVLGEGMLSYRLFRHETKIMSKMVHTLMHLGTFALIIGALVSIAQYKTAYQMAHMWSFHSWIGVCLISVYIVQFLFGAINFWLPSMETGESFLPSHKHVGLTIFIASVSQALIGYAQLPLIIQNHSNLNDTFTQSNQYGAQRLTTSSLVLNFTVIFTIIYAMCVVYLVSEDEWRRQKTPDETK